LIICENCGNKVDEKEIFCCYCNYNIQKSLENMQQCTLQLQCEPEKTWFNKILSKY